MILPHVGVSLQCSVCSNSKRLLQGIVGTGICAGVGWVHSEVLGAGVGLALVDNEVLGAGTGLDFGVGGWCLGAGTGFDSGVGGW